jgi:hypothetical protein
MDMAQCFIQMAKNMKASFLKVTNMEKESIIILKVNFLLAIGVRMLSMDKVSISIRMEQDIVASFLII